MKIGQISPEAENGFMTAGTHWFWLFFYQENRGWREHLQGALLRITTGIPQKMSMGNVVTIL